MCNYLCNTWTFAEPSTIIVNCMGSVKTPGNGLWSGPCSVYKHLSGSERSRIWVKLTANKGDFLEVGWPFGTELRRGPRLWSLGDCPQERGVTLATGGQFLGRNSAMSCQHPTFPAAVGMRFSVLGRSVRGAPGLHCSEEMRMWTQEVWLLRLHRDFCLCHSRTILISILLKKL